MSNGVKQKIITFISSLIIGLSALAGNALAATPALTLTQNGNTANLTINSASPNSAIMLYQRQSSSYWSSATYPGSTDSSGNFSGSVSITWDGSTNAMQFYVTVNGSTSNVAQLIPQSSGSGLTFSNTNPILSVGQNLAISISSSNTSSTSYYLSNNTNSSAVNPVLSGSVLTLYGQTQGSATLTVCQNNTLICGALVVTVNSSTGSSGTLTLNPTSLTSLSPGQNAPVTAGNATGNLYISSNSNSSAITTGISGSTVTVYALASGTGSLTICDQGTGMCGSVYVSVSGASNTNTSGVSLGSTNPTLNIGQSQSISIFANSGASSFTISGNTNPTVVSPNVNGSILYLIGLAAGTSTVTVCQISSSYCATAFVTVNTSGSSAVSLSQTTVNLNSGQSATVIINSGSGSYYLSGNTNPTAAVATVTGSNLYISGAGNGSASVTVCQTGNSSLCGAVSVVVGSSSGGLTFSNANPTLTSGQNLTITIYPPTTYSGSYVISGNTNTAAATPSLNGSTLTLTGNGTGSTVITVCQTGLTVCGTINATTSGSASSVINTSVYMSNINLPSMTINQFYNYQIQAQGGSGTGYVFSIANGSLPAGLSLANTGLITGTPTSAAAASFTLKVTDSSGGTSTANLTLGAVTITPAAPTPATGLSVPASSDTGTVTASGYQTGQLIKENGAIYIVYKNTKTGFANSAAFTGLGFNYKNVTDVTNSGLSPSGKTVITAQGAHPRGTWLQSGSTVYLLTPDGLVPVPTWDIFLSNGGQASFIVKANSYDLGYKKLPQMTASDSRVK